MSDPRSPWRRFVDWVRRPGDAAPPVPASAPPPLPPLPPSEEAVRAALALIDDPELGVDLDDLGLFRAWAHDGARLHVEIVLTSAACPVGPQLVEEIRSRLARSFPQLEVVVEVQHAPPWSDAALSPLALVILGRTAWEEPPPTDEPVVDLGSIPPREQAEALLDAFADLAPGRALRLHAPADPRGFADTLTAVFPGHFGWTWIRRGPRRWQARVLRLGAAP